MGGKAFQGRSAHAVVGALASLVLLLFGGMALVWSPAAPQWLVQAAAHGRQRQDQEEEEEQDWNNQHQKHQQHLQPNDDGDDDDEAAVKRARLLSSAVFGPDHLVGKVPLMESSHMTCRNGLVSRVCHFRSICWDRDERTFVYYDDPSHLPLVHTATGNGSVWKIPPDFVRIEKPSGRPCNGCFMPIKQVTGRIPPNDHVFAKESVHLYFRSFYAENFGHAIGDDMLPVYALQATFGLLTPDIKLLTPRDYAETAASPGHPAHTRARRFLGDLAHLLSDHTIGEMASDEPYSPRNQSLFGGGSLPRLTCFRSLLAGHAMLGISYDGDKFFSGFSDYLIERAAERYPHVYEAATRPLTRQRVAIIKKTGRRSVLNVDELAEYIRQTFQVRVDVFNPMSMTLSEQIAMMLTSTLIVTPEGGISYINSFIRPHTPMVFVGYWSSARSTSDHIDWHAWQPTRRFNDLYYDVRLSDITVLPPGNAQQPTHVDYMHYGAATVDLKRMARVVASGLLIAERELGLKAPSFSTARQHEFAESAKRRTI